MGLFSRIKNWFKRTFSGGGGSSSSSSRASRVSNYGGGGSRSYRDYSSGGYEHEYQSYQRRRELERQERKKKQQATTNALASISKRTDALSSGRSSSVASSATSTGTTRVLARINEKSKATPPDPKEKARQSSQQRATKMLASIDSKAKGLEKSLNNADKRITNKAEANRKAYNKATNNRYNVDKNGTKARIAQKSQAYDVNAEKYETKQHPIATSFARGAASGVTFGGSELLAQRSKNRQRTGAEQYYQKNKNRYAEMGGEIVGSLASFGLTGGASAKAVGKVTPKAVSRLSARGTEKLASSAAIRRAAEKEAIKRFGAEGATKEVINQIARRRASTAMAELGKDAAINATTGLASDLSRSYLDASKDGTFDRGEFARSMGTNAALNTVLGGATSLVPAFRVGRNFDDAIEGAVRNVAEENADDAVKAATDVRMPEVRPQTADNAVEEAVRPQTLDEAVERAATDTVERNADEAARVAETMPEQNSVRQQLVDRRNELQAEWDRFERGESKLTPYQIEEMGDELDRLDEQIRAIDEGGEQSILPAVDSSAPSTEVEAPRTEAETPRTESEPFIEGMKSEPEPKTIPPQREAVEGAKTAEQQANELRNVRKAWNDEIVEKSGGKYGFREGYSFSAKFADDKEVNRLYTNAKRLMDKVANDSASTGDMINFEGVYKRIGKEERDEIAKKAFAKAAEDPAKALERLETKLKNGDSISLDDIMQANAIEEIHKDLGIEPPEEVRQVLSRVTMESGTEYAQLMASRHLLLKENSSTYREHLITKDLDSFRKRICNIDEADWKRMAENLDKSKGTTDYLKKEIERLASLTGAENEDAFAEAYKELQKDIFRHTEPTVMEPLSLIRHTFMLSNVKTGLNNILGNVTQLEMYRMADMLQIAMEDKLAKAASRQGVEYHKKTALLKTGELKKLARWGSLQSGSVGEKLAKNADETEFEKLFNGKVKEAVTKAMGDSKFGFKSEKGADIVHDSVLRNAVGKLGRKASQAVGFMLNEPDSWFVEKSYRLAFAKYLEANGITTAEAFAKNEALINEASDYALNVAVENTYKKASRVVNFLEGARTKGYAKGSKLWQKAIALGLDAELPYLKVPVNLVVNNFKYSPIGLIKNGVQASSELHRIANGVGSIDELDRLCREMSKGLTGTGMALVGFFLACDDQMGEDNWGFISSARDELKEYGVRDNSLKIGDKNLSVANMGIGTVQFLMGTRFAEEINDRGGAPSSFLDAADVLTSVFGANFDAVADMSLLDNAFAIFDAVSNKGEYEMKPAERVGNLAFQIAGNYTGQYIPSPLRAIARGMTSADLDTGIKKGDTGKVQREISRNANNLISGVPVLNEKVLPHKVDRHGNLVNERSTGGEKVGQSIRNVTDPFNTRTVNIPNADKVELSVKKESGKPYQPKAFDENREYKAKIGQGKHAEKLDLTGKEREQAARSLKNSGEDMAHNLVYSKAAWFGDSHGERAQQILNEIPQDEEAARDYLYNTPEFKALDNEQRVKFMDALYDKRLGRGRSANHEVYVNIKGGDEGDFRYQNDLHWRQQDKYEETGLADAGITKGQWADIIEAAKYESHKFKDGANVDTINSAYKLKTALMSMEDLTPEQRVAAYQAIRGKRNGFGWYDWDGASLKGYRRRRGRRRRGYRSYGGGSSAKATVPKPKAIKASSFLQGEALVSKRSSSSAKVTPPTLKRVQAKIDLPTKR